MLRISKLTDYAVLLATTLPADGETRSVRDLAAASHLPQATVGKVLKLLAKAGVVSSQRGPSGGYRLARAASEIPVVEVIAAIEGPIAVTECSDGGITSDCEYQGCCGTRANWKRINDAVYHALAAIPLSEMQAVAPDASAASPLGARSEGPTSFGVSPSASPMIRISKRSATGLVPLLPSASLPAARKGAVESAQGE